MIKFTNRFFAGKLLADKLEEKKIENNSIILAIPRGGLQVGYELAKKLQLELDVILTKKIGYPGNPEYAIGSVSLDNVVINSQHKNISSEYLATEIKKIRHTLKARFTQYLIKEKPAIIKNKTVIITDDGVATGSTLFAAIDIVKQAGAKKIIVAIPVGPADVIEQIKAQIDTVVYLLAPEYFGSLSLFYEKFVQIDDQEAIELLKKAHKNFNHE